MCVITDNNNIIISISLIRGLDAINDRFNVYEYVDINGLHIGGYYLPESE